MDQQSFARIVERAQKDPEYLRALVFAPETLVPDVKDHLTRRQLGAALSKSPAEVIARTIGIDQYCGNTCTSSCDNTCGGSCGFTTNLTDEVAARVTYFARDLEQIAECGNTCTSSCDNTCGGSCGFTTNLTDFGSIAARGGQAFR
ncbi:MAG: hypothetical protein J7503_13895 [Cellulomonas iranensis]|jgi:hypothetical protein|uniref:4Fe-4S ferredoxin-type domain-containing protein n=1 Tax=Cellulomonas iranensis TaxID=76862 RepID=A0ABU0GN77_9CELL|nr:MULTISPECIES: hypothetical protein [Cellulomonas]MBO9569896.1 hypothetical protein [Cellulomonas iranensis]MDQ0426829.1 hypothetical protein [Cellulomonas iranensis]TFH74440.1 hypothetical protein E4A51_03130 [Cellulomonas sp. HD19AZ1]UCN16204.1 hypothetical protein LFM56_07850 [Cellulomonas iranensis]